MADQPQPGTDDAQRGAKPAHKLRDNTLVALPVEPAVMRANGLVPAVLSTLAGVVNKTLHHAMQKYR